MRGLAHSAAALSTAVVLPLLQGFDAQAQEERLPWNQDKVTVLAIRLSAELGRIQAAFDVAQQNASDIQRREGYATMKQLGELKATASDLSTRLSAGAGREATNSSFQELRTLRARIESVAQQAGFGDAATENIVAAQSIIDELARYY